MLYASKKASIDFLDSPRIVYLPRKYIDPLSPNTCRFVSLLPGGADDPVELWLLDEQLESVPTGYEALSYYWGNPAHTAKIAVDNAGELGVTDNLHAALRLLSFPDQVRALWIDALCIDQSNPKERSAQVRRMGDIYRTAVCVLVWLGEDQIVKNSEVCVRQFGWPEQIGSMADRIDDLVLRVENTGGEPAQTHAQTLAPRGPLEMYLANRVCIIQEVALAREITIHCGQFSWSWTSFHRVCESVRKVSGPFSAFMAFDNWPEKMQRIRSLGSTTETLDLHQFLREFRSSQATDSRDKVYGLLGLTDVSMPVDYELVFFEVQKMQISTHMSLNFLSGWPWPQ
ncbi:Heterokaryon incompatibility protein 6,OR allele [Lachnellula willkommii]|uniref:Heterokaryon incompatibility protein 6,OR allele n=1 Tax=Lachnellula willkommii TaxID=215461 RepID=A0A559MGG8_9HELO|nr:Heterokaryon incompatibility protein 6,OR allele [Lachnellula willkommii]